MPFFLVTRDPQQVPLSQFRRAFVHHDPRSPAHFGGGSRLNVPNNRTVLQVIRDVVPGVSVGCEQGICGACRTTILAGEADHRDALLSNAERAAGAILICVSRARTKKLTLDL
jgi:ferredoxin